MFNFVSFNAFDRAYTSCKKEIAAAWNNGKRIRIFVYGILFLAAVVVSISLVINAVSIVVPAIGKVAQVFTSNESRLAFDPKTISYSRLERSKNVDGLYRNLFEIYLHNPAGNTNAAAFITINFGQGAECEYGSGTERIEFAPGLASSTKRVLLDCLTKEPIIDDGQLFGIVE